MSAIPQPDNSASSDPSASRTGSPPPTGVTGTTDPSDTPFYDAHPLSRSNPEEFELDAKDVGYVVANGKKYGPYLSTRYLTEDLLPATVEAGTLYAVRSGTMLWYVWDITVRSRDHVDIEVALSCAVQISSPEDLIDEREPEDKLDLILESAAYSVFGRFTSEQLKSEGATPVDSETLIEAIRDICVRDFRSGRGVAGLEMQRVDFVGAWTMRDGAKQDSTPTSLPPTSVTAAPLPPDDAHLVDLLYRNPDLLKGVIAVCLSEATSLGMLPADSVRFKPILDAQLRLPQDALQRLQQMMQGALPGFTGGKGSGTP